MTSAGFARVLSFCLASILCAASCVLAQSPRSQASAKAEAAGSNVAIPELRIRVLEGENAINSISQGQSIPPVAEVRDQNDMPVEGATVVFTLPESGPGGSFPGGRASF